MGALALSSLLNPSLRAGTAESGPFLKAPHFAPKAKNIINRMFPYVFAKFSRFPAGPKEAADEVKARALLTLSEGVALYRKGKKDAALSHTRSEPPGKTAGIIDQKWAV